MSFNKESATERAVQDLAKRLSLGKGEIAVSSVDSAEFPDMSLGAPEADEMAAQMIANGWKIRLTADGKNYEYRADKYQIRLKGFGGKNHVIVY